MPTLAGEPVGALGMDARYPVNRLDVVHQGGLVEQTLLGHKRRAMPWLAGLPFQGFNQGGFLTADIGTSATAKDDKTWLDDGGRFELGNRLFENTVLAGYSSRK